MNKIIIDNENIELKKITKKVNISIVKRDDFFGIPKVNIDVLSDTSMVLDYNLVDNKYNFIINVMPNVNFCLAEFKKGIKGKIQYTINLFQDSTVTIDKYTEADDIKEALIFNLNGEGATLNYNFKAICQNKDVYDLTINHNCSKTISNIKNNIVNIENGKASFQVSSYVPKGKINCNVVQNNRIINLTDNKCEIRPNLYIDEYDTNASHSALIGGFDSHELFYLKTRGINELEANKLLITGFLLSDLNNKDLITKIMRSIKKYWR